MIDMKARILVAGVGNIFLGDDAFGVEVAQEMLRRPAIAGAKVVDFGIRGLDLTYPLLEDYEAAIIVDAVPRGGAPGTVYLIEPETDDPAACAQISQEDFLIETHGMHPAKVLRLVAGMGGKMRRALVVGCEPTPFDPETDMQMELSAPVKAAIPEAISMIESIAAEILSNQPKGTSHVVTTGADVR